MKTYIKYISTLFAAASLMVACQPEEFSGADINGIPSIGDIAPVVEVDQELNQVTFSLPEGCEGLMPVWIFTENKGTDKEKVSYSSVNGLKKIFAKAGDYEFEFKLMNRNGVSDGSKTGTFHINNTLMDFGKYFTQLCGGKENSTKEWRIDNEKAGHLGCGPSGTTGTEWWSANPDAKKDFNVYDSRMTFGVTNGADNGTYSFNPGESGQIYVNYGCATFNTTGATEDFCVDAAAQETTFQFEVDGEDVILTFPAHTYFAYIANDDIWENPRYKVESMTNSEINLVIDNGDIAWHYILTSGAAKVAFNGFDVNSPDNLWKQANATFLSQYYAHGGGWESNGEYVHTETDGVYTLTLPLASDQQWQCQYQLQTKLSSTQIVPGNKYDFSCKVTSTTALPGVTFKFTDASDNLTLFNNQNGPLAVIPAYEETVVYFTECEAPSIDGNYKFVFDFGGNPENTEITIKDIVIIDHSKNTIAPPSEDEDEEPESDVIWSDVNDPLNLMTSGTLTLDRTWFANDGWAELGNQPTVEITERNAKITVNEANGGSQWQGQVHFNTQVAIEEGKAYDFSITLTPSQEFAAATVKPHPEGDDDHMFSAAQHALTGYEDNVITVENYVADFNTGNLVITLDFPGCAAGTTIEVKNIIIQEHRSNKVTFVDGDSEQNLINSGTVALVSTWFADNGWGELANQPTVEINGRKVMITVNEANGGSQWQGQVHLSTSVAIEEGKTYDFAITMCASQDIAAATVKPHPQGDDDHMFSAAQHALAAYEDVTVTYTNFTSDFSTDNLVLTLDFPGCAAGTTIEVKEIILQVR